MSCFCKSECDNFVTQLTNISKVWKGGFLKTAEVNFYIKYKKTSDLKVKQFTDALFGSVCEQLNLIIEVCNLGPEIEGSGKLIDIFTNENNLNIKSVVITKGTYTLENGIFIWDIGQIAPEEQLFAVIAFKPKKAGLYRSVAKVYGDNYDTNQCNNFSKEKIPVLDLYLKIELLIIMTTLITLILIAAIWNSFRCSEVREEKGDG